MIRTATSKLQRTSQLLGSSRWTAACATTSTSRNEALTTAVVQDAPLPIQLEHHKNNKSTQHYQLRFHHASGSGVSIFPTNISSFGSGGSRTGGGGFSNGIGIIQPRYFSATADDNDYSSSSSQSVDDTLEKLFQENQQIQSTGTEPWVDGASAAAADAASNGMDFVPTWWNPADQCLQLIMKTSEITGWELSVSIIAVTAIARTVIFPVVIMGQRSSSRMAHVQPELQQLKVRYERLQNPSHEQKMKFGQQVRDLFKRYDVNPMRSALPPLIQLPFFMGMFFGLKKMPDYFPNEMMNGGMLWFPDLTQTDPLYILPIACTLSFLATVELGKEQMMASNPQHASSMINVFRGLSLLMLPICLNFHAGMLCYWSVTNAFTLTQIGIMKIPFVKKAFGIWDPPKPVPGSGGGGKDEGLFNAAKNLMDTVQGKPKNDELSKIKQHNEKLEMQKQVEKLNKSSRDRRRRAIKKRG